MSKPVEEPLTEDVIKQIKEKFRSNIDKHTFKTDFFEKHSLRLEIMNHIKESPCDLLMWCGIDWGVIEKKPLIKPDNISVEEFAKQE